MKIALFAIILALGFDTFAVENGKLPTLHKIESYTFQKPYSCDGGSYETSALFLSDFSKKRNSPELLFNASCGSTPYLEASTAGDDFSLISDLGNVSLESATAAKAFNYERTVGQDNTFKETMPAIEGHTYSVLITKSDIRTLYVLRIESVTDMGELKIKYAVKSYSIQKTISSSPGFDWEKENK